MKKWLLIAALTFTTSNVIVATEASATTVKQVKKIKKLAKSGKTLHTKNLKLNDPYEKFHRLLGKPVETRSPQGAAFIDRFKNGTMIVTSGYLDSNWNLHRVKGDKVYSITNRYSVKYKMIRKVFGSAGGTRMSYVSSENSITYKVGKYTVWFTQDVSLTKTPNGKLTNTTKYNQYSITK
ncbi:DUF4309 domain-containing protein [Kurthia massiliensis]|uniref:DUF4309 domain-containing protein n=1 Tax=Kurthia massiliensis TaxID=1033739 RepID=UPI000287ABEC|nr:DUF4309 domain-containing protein [Kurthia massiliensis]